MDPISMRGVAAGNYTFTDERSNQFQKRGKLQIILLQKFSSDLIQFIKRHCFQMNELFKLQ